MAELLGQAATSRGGGSNYQCVPEDPENFDFGAGTLSDAAYMHGVEYQSGGTVPSATNNMANDDVPCCVCYAATRVAVSMIPGKYTCPPN